jgi:hypothetical protein
MPVEISSESKKMNNTLMYHNATLSNSNEKGKHDMLEVTAYWLLRDLII